MSEVAVFLGVAAAGYALSYRLRIPALPILIIFGLGLSLTPLAPSRETARAIVEFGLAFIVFGAGIELSPRRFARHTGAVLWVAAVQFLVVGLAGIFAARALGYGETTSIYIGFAISASSTLVVIRHLRAQQQMFQPFGRLVTGVLLVQDVAIVVLLVALSADGDLRATMTSISAFALLAAAASACHTWIFPQLTARLRSDDETLLLAGIAALFAFAGAALLMGLPIIAGAFLAGFALASSPGNGLMRGLIGSLTDFFQALFFTALGSLLVISSFSIPLHAVLLALLVFVVTPPVVAAVAEWRGQTARSGVESGLLLAQTSELGIVFAMAGMQLGHLGEAEFTVVAIVAALTMTITPFVATDAVTWKLLHWHPSSQRRLASLALRDHVLILGFGSAGMWAVKPLIEAGHPVLVVDDDPAVLDALSQAGIPWWRGDASDRHTLEATRARDAKLILASLPRVPDLVKVIRHAKGVPVVARVFEEQEARIIQRAGGFAILNSEAATEQFCAWFDNWNRRV